MTVLAAALALVAALLFAVANVAQQRAASDVPDESAKGIGLIKRLVRKPLWLAGFGGDFGGYIAQAAALGVGSLLLVQPLLVTALLFALPLGAWWAGRKLRRADWMWAIVLAVSLGIFVVAGNPTKRGGPCRCGRLAGARHRRRRRGRRVCRRRGGKPRHPSGCPAGCRAPSRAGLR